MKVRLEMNQKIRVCCGFAGPNVRNEPCHTTSTERISKIGAKRYARRFFMEPAFPRLYGGGHHPNGTLIKQVLTPLGLALAKHAHQMTAGVQTEGPRLARQFHTGFVGGAVSLPVVTGMAASHEIFPGRFAGAGAGYDVIECQLARGHRAMAILAGVAVAHQDVLAR